MCTCLCTYSHCTHAKFHEGIRRTRNVQDIKKKNHDETRAHLSIEVCWMLGDVCPKSQPDELSCHFSVTKIHKQVAHGLYSAVKMVNDCLVLQLTITDAVVINTPGNTMSRLLSQQKLKALFVGLLGLAKDGACCTGPVMPV